MARPNFLLIGANKAGTTSVAAYLAQHPQVYVSPTKEPRFFVLEGCSPERRRRAADWEGATFTSDDYFKLFDAVANEKAIGEASTNYLSEHMAPIAIKRYLPETKLVAILRHPAERAFSNYSYLVARGHERLSFSDAVRAELDRVPTRGHWERHYVSLGFYGTQLARFHARFSRDQIRVFLYEDLRRDPQQLMREFYRFLEVDEDFVPDTNRHYNVTLVPRNPKINAVVRRHERARKLVRNLVPSSLYARASKSLHQYESPPEFPPETRRLLIDLYRSDILYLQDLIGRDLSSWTE